MAREKFMPMMLRALHRIQSAILYPRLTFNYITNQPSPMFELQGARNIDGLTYPVSLQGNQKFFVIGLPKSGNVWLQSLICDALDQENVHPWRDYGRSGVSGFHSRLNAKTRFRDDVLRTVYVMRDIRDVIVSFYHYSKTEDYRTNEDPTADFSSMEQFYFEYFLPVITPIYGWEFHAAEYLSTGMSLVRYERLCDGPLEELSRLFRRWRIEVPRESIENAVTKNDIKKLKYDGKPMHRMLPPSHFRKGGYGSYKTEMAEDILKDVEQRFGDYLMRWGYKLTVK